MKPFESGSLKRVGCPHYICRKNGRQLLGVEPHFPLKHGSCLIVCTDRRFVDWRCYTYSHTHKHLGNASAFRRQGLQQCCCPPLAGLLCMCQPGVFATPSGPSSLFTLVSSSLCPPSLAGMGSLVQGGGDEDIWTRRQ